MDSAALLDLADAFQTASLTGEGWHDALAHLAQATGSRTGELIGVGSDAAVPFNLMTGMDPAFHADFIARGGGDAALNPYVAAGASAPLLEVLSDEQLLHRDDIRRYEWHRDLAERWDVPHGCITKLECEAGVQVGLAVIRSRRDGPITTSQRRVFAAVAPHVRTAVRTQIALENQGSRLLGQTFDGLSMVAFVCDRRGRVRTLTPAAETLVRRGDLLQLGDGLLTAVCRRDAQALSDAIDRVTYGEPSPGQPLVATVVLRGADTLPPIALEILRLPLLAHEFSFTPRVLIVSRQTPDTQPTRLVTIARLAYGLTAAEAEVSASIVAGLTPSQIAQQRGVAIDTARAQLKTAMSKLGVRRQAELVQRLTSL